MAHRLSHARAHGGTFRYVENLTIDDIRYAREKGTFLLRRVVERKGNRLYGAWVTDDGTSVIVWEGEVRE